MEKLLPGETSRNVAQPPSAVRTALGAGATRRVTQIARVLEAVRARGAHGATRHELATELGMRLLPVTSCVWELLGRNKRHPGVPRLVESGARIGPKGYRNKVLVAVDLERDEDLGRRIEEYVRSRGEAGATRREIASALNSGTDRTSGPSPNSVRLQVRYLLGECAWDRAAPRLRRNGTRPGPHGIERQVFVAC